MPLENNLKALAQSQPDLAAALAKTSPSAIAGGNSSEEVLQKLLFIRQNYPLYPVLYFYSFVDAFVLKAL